MFEKTSLQKSFLTVIAIMLIFLTLSVQTVYAASAGLMWGPVYTGNLKFYMTSQHSGYAGPKFPNAPHVNFHIDKKNSRGSYSIEVDNFHIVKYMRGKNICIYVWDSVTRKTVFDNCTTNWSSAIRNAVSSMKSFAQRLTANADWIAIIAIWGLISVAMIALLLAFSAIVFA